MHGGNVLCVPERPPFGTRSVICPRQVGETVKQRLSSEIAGNRNGVPRASRGEAMTATSDDTIADLRAEVSALRAERDAALAQRGSDYAERMAYQAATIDVLKAMSASAGDPRPVVDLIADRARDVCDAYARPCINSTEPEHEWPFEGRVRRPKEYGRSPARACGWSKGWRQLKRWPAEATVLQVEGKNIGPIIRLRRDADLGTNRCARRWRDGGGTRAGKRTQKWLIYRPG